ncbi:MAG: isochorismate synthase [Thermoleophilaceae bacterium]
MEASTRPAHNPFAPSAGALETLAGRLDAGIASARRRRSPVLASLTVAIDPDADATAALLAARRRGDDYLIYETEELQLSCLGKAAAVEARGADRFRGIRDSCRALSATAIATDSDAQSPPASGPVWVGGFAFAPEGGRSPEWSSFAPARLVMPELSVARAHGQARLTMNVLCTAEAHAQDLLVALDRRLAQIHPASMPLLDPDPVGAARVASAAAPEHFEAAVERAVERIARGDVTKVVLAREVRVHGPAPFDPAAIYDALRAGFPSCYRYLVGTPDAAFVGASPELLVRREGQRLQTVALAGTRRRSADPSVDAHLGEQLMRSPKDREEQAIVTRRIERTLAPVSVWVAAAEEPMLVRVLNVQHLATPIRAQLTEALSCVELAGLLHPTPAVAGEPRDQALSLIPALEGLDRGWYAGPVGWMDLAEDGEFCVALRCALLRSSVAHLYAGEGIVRDSVPAEELAANEAKLSALLPLLT